MGGLVAAVLVMGEGLRLFTARPVYYVVFGILAAVFASYQTWREEAERAHKLTEELRQRVIWGQVYTIHCDDCQTLTLSPSLL